MTNTMLAQANLGWRFTENNMRFGTCEIFYSELKDQTPDTCFWDKEANGPVGAGWFFWCCLPGCLPEGDPIGPFKTRAAAYITACDQGFIEDEDEDEETTVAKLEEGSES